MQLKQKMQSKFKQAGMTLTESLLVLGVGALVAAIGYGGYRMATSSVTVSSQTSGTVTLIGGVKRIFGVATDYSAVTVANVINSKLVPSDFRTTGTTAINNAWGGTITPAVGNQAGATPVSQFKFSVTSIPAESCADFVTGVASSSYSIWIGGTTAGTHDVKPAGANVDTARLVTQCSAAATADPVIVIN